MSSTNTVLSFDHESVRAMVCNEHLTDAQCEGIIQYCSEDIADRVRELFRDAANDFDISLDVSMDIYG